MKVWFNFILVISLGMIFAGHFLSGWLPIIGLLLLGLDIHMWLTSKCPACKRYWARKQVGKNYIRSSEKFWDKDDDGKQGQYQNHYYEIIFRCEHCGHEWTKEVKEKEQLGNS